MMIRHPLAKCKRMDYNEDMEDRKLPPTRITREDTTMETRCSKCGGLGEVPAGVAHLAGAQACAWAMCPACHGAGVHYECFDCMGTGVNVYAEDFDPAHPQPCRSCHVQPVAA